VGEGREAALAVVVAGLTLLAAFRTLPARAEPVGLPCAAEAVGGSRGQVRCGGRLPLRAGERRVLGLPIDLNAATPEELEALPGIGAKLAARIVEDRQRRGAFATLGDLGRVPGIGPGKLRLLAGQAAVLAGPPPDPSRYSRPTP